MTIEEARQKLQDALNPSAIGCKCDLAEVVKLMWDHLDGRGVLSGEPFLKGMQPLATSEEVKAEK